MMNKKLIAILVAVTTIAAISAEYYIDRNGVERRDGLVRNTGRATGDVVEGTGRATGTVVGGAADITAGTIGGLFGGRGVGERMDDRKARREERRNARDEKRNTRESRRNSDYAGEARIQRNGNSRNQTSGNQP